MKRKFFNTTVGLMLLGAFLGTLTPSLVDPIHFYLINYFIPSLTGVSKILWEVFDWYLLDALYYVLLMGIAFILAIKKASNMKKIIILGGIIGLGVVVGILGRILF